MESHILSEARQEALKILLDLAKSIDRRLDVEVREIPGQERLAEDMGMSRSRVTEFIGELEKAGLVTIQRRGQGRTNFYTIHFQVKATIRRLDVGRSTSRSRPVHY
jgi:DNA-binding FadR family transcriptional regulator